MTPEQLLLLHHSEANYEIGYVGQVAIEGGRTISALMYIGDDFVLTQGDQPIAIASIPRKNGQFIAMDSRAVVNYMLDHPSVRRELTQINPDFNDC